MSEKILIVDDEVFNRELLVNYLSSDCFSTVSVGDGEEAWALLDNSAEHEFSSILLDRLMPRLDGMALLKRIKSDARFAYLPVIFQTSMDDSDSIAEGIAAGAFYYLTKPFTRDTLLGIVRSAVDAHADLRIECKKADVEQQQYQMLLQQAIFQVRTLQDIRILAVKIADFFPDSQRVLLGINELLINAVEHGNLGISYQDKSMLLQQGRWESEIEHRLTLPDYADKVVKVQLDCTRDHVMITVTDQGLGFDWRQYLEISPERAFDIHGRGIAMSKLVSFDALHYQGCGNAVSAIVKL